MQNDVDAQIFQLFLKLIRGDLSGILCDDDTADIQVDAAGKRRSDAEHPDRR